MDYNMVCMMTQMDENSHSTYKKNIKDLMEDNEELMEEYDKLTITELEQRRYNQCRLSILTFNKTLNNIVEYIEAGEIDTALVAYEQEMAPAKACTYELLNAVVELSEYSAERKNEQNAQIYQTLFGATLALIIIGIVVAALITYYMSRYLINQLNEIKCYAKRIAEYDVTTDIVTASDDEFGQTIEALNDAQFMIRELLEKIIEQSSFISDTGEDVSLAVRKASQRIEDANVEAYQSNQLIASIEEGLRHMAKDEELGKSKVKQIKSQAKELKKIKTQMDNLQKELSGLTMHLEQIAITCDYQNEMAKEHRTQVEKFQV
jgi:methyl-accepting chemotaxis protein